MYFVFTNRSNDQLKQHSRNIFQSTEIFTKIVTKRLNAYSSCLSRRTLRCRATERNFLLLTTITRNLSACINIQLRPEKNHQSREEKHHLEVLISCRWEAISKCNLDLNTDIGSKRTSPTLWFNNRPLLSFLCKIHSKIHSKIQRFLILRELHLFPRYTLFDK